MGVKTIVTNHDLSLIGDVKSHPGYELKIFGVPHNPSPIAVSGWDSYAVVAAKKYTHLIDKILSDLAFEQQRDAFDRKQIRGDNRI
jgi:hypothetical protein